VQLQISELNVQDVANTGWAFAKLHQLDEKLVVALAKQADIANTAWAFAMLGQLDEKLFVTLLEPAVLRFSQFNA